MEERKHVGISKEDFEKLYDQERGFNYEFNKNHPMYNCNEDFFDFVLSGAQRLTKEKYELVVNSDVD